MTLDEYVTQNKKVIELVNNLTGKVIKELPKVSASPSGKTIKIIKATNIVIKLPYLISGSANFSLRKTPSISKNIEKIAIEISGITGIRSGNIGDDIIFT